MLCQCYSEAIQSEVNCSSEWIERTNTVAKDDTHHSVSTLVECKNACEFDPRCVAVDWNSYDKTCDLNTETNHTHDPHQSIPPRWNHYDLVSRCDVTSGQCFDSNVIVNMTY